MRVCMCMRAYVCVYECVCVCTGTTQTYEETLGHYEPVPQKPRHHGERPPFPSPLTPGASSSDLVHGQSGQDQGLVFKGIPAGRDRAMTTGDHPWFSPGGWFGAHQRSRNPEEESQAFLELSDGGSGHPYLRGRRPWPGT